MRLLFGSVSEQRAYLALVQKKIHPNYTTGGTWYRHYISQALVSDARVLDAGAGDAGMIAEFKSRIGRLIGIDMSAELLSKNTILDEKITANLEAIPLPDATVDLVISEFVFEHLEYPEKVFTELHRILKPGGALIFLTPNRYNPVMVASALLPHAVHAWFRTKILKKDEETHPTFYRANTARYLRSALAKAGFACRQFERAGNPEYVGVTKSLMWLALLFERFIDNRVLGWLKMYIIGYFIKQ